MSEPRLSNTNAARKRGRDTSHVRMEHLILADGARTAALGRVVATADSVTFEPPLPRAEPLFAPGREPPPQPSGLGIAVEGVDLDALADRRAKGGAVEGWAWLAGVWRSEMLVVDIQEPALPTARPTKELREPPCTGPAAGWPRGADGENLDLAGFQHDDEALVAISLFRPSARQVVLVVATTDPEGMERELRPRFDQRVCVVASTWTKAQVDEVTAALRINMRAWRLYQTGLAVREDGQAEVNADAVLVTEQFASWAEHVPDGLLQVDPWLAPNAAAGPT